MDLKRNEFGWLILLVLVLGFTVLASLHFFSSRERVPVPPNSVSLFSRNPLIVAVAAGDYARVKSLLRSGADPNASASVSSQSMDFVGNGSRPSAPVKPLHTACHGRHERIARLLLNAGADPNVLGRSAFFPNGPRTTALHLSIPNGSKSIVGLLLDFGASPVIRDESGTVPLCVAAEAGRLSLAREMVSAGGEKVLNTRNSTGKTALHVASQVGQPQIVAYLLEAGVNVDVETFGGSTSLDIALSAGRKDCVRMLVRYGAQVPDNMREEVSKSLSAP